METIIVSTRVSEQQLNTTYINGPAASPYIMTIILREPPHRPVGLTPEQVPNVGETIVIRGGKEA